MVGEVGCYKDLRGGAVLVRGFWGGVGSWGRWEVSGDMKFVGLMWCLLLMVRIGGLGEGCLWRYLQR